MEHTQREALFNAAVSQLGLAAFDGIQAWGIKQITLPHHSSQGLSCEILIPETCLVVLQISQGRQWDCDIPPFTYTTCYHGRWMENLHQLYKDLTLLVEGKRRDGPKSTTSLRGTPKELNVWVGSGQKEIEIVQLPGKKCILADNLLLKTVVRFN